ncbi:hypothetical protein [Roseovarius sp. M141]|uniref:DUF2515 family protein n=1 Tax=Roseovarius sp. M141 TaxID=2583806 RepID=UPI0020CFD3DD|nr:hypothetical protein [Roseovarius sp. M141]
MPQDAPLSTTSSSFSSVGTCPDNCEEAMAQAHDEVNQIRRQGPGAVDFNMAEGSYREVPAEVMRNGRITQAYSDLARDMPENHWVRLASYVSVQGGCAMRQFTNPSQNWPGAVSDFPQNGLAALGDANVAIFESIYPPNRMAANCGIDRFLECVENGEIEVNENIVRAMKQMRDGDLRRAANTIARYEQEEVVQPVYARWPGTFQTMAAIDTVNVFQDMTSIPIARTCTRDGLVPLEGSISNPRDRVDYYEALLNEMYRIEGIN